MVELGRYYLYIDWFSRRCWRAKIFSFVFIWLSQLLEDANVVIIMYEKCKCALSNEIYMLALNVCIQLLDFCLNKNTTSATPINVNKNNSIFEWVIRKCYSPISQEIAVSTLLRWQEFKLFIMKTWQFWLRKMRQIKIRIRLRINITRLLIILI